MEVLEVLLDELSQLEKQVVRLIDERHELKQLVVHLKEENAKLDVQNSRLEQELLKASKNIGSPKVEQKPNGAGLPNFAIKTKLDEYIKEIEKCIEQLNE